MLYNKYIKKDRVYWGFVVSELVYRETTRTEIHSMFVYFHSNSDFDNNSIFKKRAIISADVIILLKTSLTFTLNIHTNNQIYTLKFQSSTLHIFLCVLVGTPNLHVEKMLS